MREAEEGEREDRKKEGNGLRDLGWRDWAGERKQPEHMMPDACSTHSCIREFSRGYLCVPVACGGKKPKIWHLDWQDYPLGTCLLHLSFV